MIRPGDLVIKAGPDELPTPAEPDVYLVLAVTEPPSYRARPIVGNLRVVVFGRLGTFHTWHDWLTKL